MWRSEESVLSTMRDLDVKLRNSGCQTWWQSLSHTELSCQPPKKSGFERTGYDNIPVITAVRSLRQEDHHKFEASLSYAMSLSLSPSYPPFFLPSVPTHK